MTNFLEEVKEKINKKLSPEQLSIVDNSNLHTKHKSFNLNKFHIRLTIKSKKLKSMKKIDAHKLIFSILKNEMNDKIHALEIEIE